MVYWVPMQRVNKGLLKVFLQHLLPETQGDGAREMKARISAIQDLVHDNLALLHLLSELFEQTRLEVKDNADQSRIVIMNICRFSACSSSTVPAQTAERIIIMVMATRSIGRMMQHVFVRRRASLANFTDCIADGTGSLSSFSRANQKGSAKQSSLSNGLWAISCA